MEADTTLPAGAFEDEEYEEWVSYAMQMHDAIAPIIKKFLIDYFGGRMYNLEPATYREMDKVIKDGFLFGECIVEYFYIHRTIKEDDLWEEALNKFERKNAKFSWIKKPQWYDRDYLNDDEEEFLEGIPDSELTEEEKRVQAIIKSADEIINFHVGFSAFIKKGCDLIIPAMQNYMEDTASFDLSILSPEGYEHIQDDLDGIADYLFDHLYMLVIQ